MTTSPAQDKGMVVDTSAVCLRRVCAVTPHVFVWPWHPRPRTALPYKCTIPNAIDCTVCNVQHATGDSYSGSGQHRARAEKRGAGGETGQRLVCIITCVIVSQRALHAEVQWTGLCTCNFEQPWSMYQSGRAAVGLNEGGNKNLPTTQPAQRVPRICFAPFALQSSADIRGF